MIECGRIRTATVCEFGRSQACFAVPRLGLENLCEEGARLGVAPLLHQLAGEEGRPVHLRDGGQCFSRRREGPRQVANGWVGIVVESERGQRHPQRRTLVEVDRRGEESQRIQLHEFGRDQSIA